MITPQFGEIGERLRRSTVHVSTGRHGAGSGVIWNREGLIVTNAHVIDSGAAIVTLWDNRQYKAKLIRTVKSRDLALLRLEAHDLEAVSPGDSSRLRPGELVIAVGNPLGFIGALTTGVVHAVGPVAGLPPSDYIQAAIRLAPGNSGGPLADMFGRVVGINSMVVSGGIGLAIPSNLVRSFVAGVHPRERAA